MKIGQFIDYVMSFYIGPEAIYPKQWRERDIVNMCFERYQDKKNYCGDTFDREWVRDRLMDLYGEV